MPWKVSAVMNERAKFIIRLNEGEKMSDLCKEFGISRKTGYKFLDRYKEGGFQGLIDISRRPDRLARKLPDTIKRMVLELKDQYPTWGAKKLHAKLIRKQIGIRIPSKSTIRVWLDKAGLVKKRKRRRDNSGYWITPLPTSEKANDVWCADYKGEFQTGDKKYCYPLTITDHKTRYFIECEGQESTKVEGAVDAFKEAFTNYGLPLAICTDNGAPFASRGLVGLTRLSVWWLRLGIKVYRIEPGHPEQNGRHERLHLTLKQETTRPAGENILQQQEKFDRFRDIYNNERPHESLGMKSPSEVYQPSMRKYHGELEPLEYPLHDLVREVSHDGCVTMTKSFYLGAAFAGENVGLREIEDDKWVISFMSMDLGLFDLKINKFEPAIGQIGTGYKMSH